MLIPFKGLSEGNDSSLVKRNLLSFDLSKKTIQNSGLINQNHGLVYSITYERLFSPISKHFFIGLGGNISYNHCNFSLSTSSTELNKNSYSNTEIKNVGMCLSTSLNYKYEINNNSSFLFRLNPRIGIGTIISSKTSGYRNDSLLYISKNPSISSLKDAYNNNFFILGMNSEVGIIKKTTNKSSIFIALGININNNSFSKLSIVTRIVEPTIRLGIFL